MSFVVPLAEDDFVLTKGADSSDNSPDRDGRHNPQHGETNEREREREREWGVIDRWMDGGGEHERRHGEREKGAVLGIETLTEVCWLKAKSEDRKVEKKGR